VVASHPLRQAPPRSPARILVLGAGFGGLELTTRLSAEFGDGIDIVLVDQSDCFVFGFSKMDVMFGRADPSTVRHPYRNVVKPGVRFIPAAVRAIDPASRSAATDRGTFEADILVVALGADLHPEATPGLAEAGHEFYTVDGAFALREVLAGFKGGHVVVAVTSTPFKCPPAPSETALLTDEYLTARGLRERSRISLVMPLGTPIPPSPAASEALVRAFAERGIAWLPNRLVRSLDPTSKIASLSDGTQIPFDLFLGVPVHRAPAVVIESGLTVDGWVPVDPLTLETRYSGVYAIGDVTSVGTPKAGVFAEGQAGVVADRISALLRANTPSARYDGRGICYLEFGNHQVARVDVTFVAGQTPTGGLDGPSQELAVDKHQFATSRIRRWFDRPTQG
jgi:sulfide:quinone oxidoreductase